MQPTTGSLPTSTYSAYEAIVGALSRPELAEALRARRSVFEAKTGAVDPDDNGFEARMQAFWDGAVTNGDLLGKLDGDFGPWLEAFRRAHRGLFRVRRDGELFVLDDVWSGAAFILMPAPSRELALSLESTEGLFDGRLIGSMDPPTVALLPGAVFHPPDATPSIEKVLDAARKQGMSKDDALDALLRMEARLRAHSRVKPSYAYRL